MLNYKTVTTVLQNKNDNYQLTIFLKIFVYTFENMGKNKLTKYTLLPILAFLDGQAVISGNCSIEGYFNLPWNIYNKVPRRELVL